MIGVKSKKCSVAIWSEIELSSALRGRSPFLISFRLQTLRNMVADFIDYVLHYMAC